MNVKWIGSFKQNSSLLTYVENERRQELELDVKEYKHGSEKGKFKSWKTIEIKVKSKNRVKEYSLNFFICTI